VKHHDSLNKLQQDASEAKAKARTAEAELETVRTKAADARTGWVEAEAAGKTDAISTAKKARAAATTELEQAEVTAEAARLRADRATAQASGYTVEHARDLIDELSDEATTIRDRLRDHANALMDADRAWHTMAGRVGGYLAAGGTAPRGNLPDQHGLEQAIREVKRALVCIGEPPLPLPHYAAAKFAQRQELDARKAKADRDAQREREQRQRNSLDGLVEKVNF
jgi:hypothetical protein